MNLEKLLREAPGLCWDIDFFRCEHANNCTAHKQGCAAMLFDGFPETTKKALKDHTRKEGYTFGGIEYDLLCLNQMTDIQMTLFGEKKKHSWRHFCDARGKLLPLDLRQYKLKAEGKYHLRPSELGYRCGIGKLINKINKKLHFPELPSNPVTEAGTGMHWLSNKQEGESIHNELLSALGNDILPRDAYCEQQMQTSINGVMLRGSPDVVLQLGNTLVIFDFKTAKKGAYESLTVKSQLLGYALMIDNLLENRFDSYVIIARKRFWSSGEGKKTYPEYSVQYIPKDSRWIDELKERMVASVHHQRKLIESRAAFEEEIDGKAHKKCLMSQTEKGKIAGMPGDCSYLAPRLLEEHPVISKYLSKDVDLFLEIK